MPGTEPGKSVCLGTPAQLAGETPCLPSQLSAGCQPALHTLSLPSRHGLKAGECLCWGQVLIPGNSCVRAGETLALLESKASWLKARYIKSSLASIEIFWLCLSLGAFHSSELLRGLRTAQLRSLFGGCFSQEHLEVGSCCLFRSVQWSFRLTRNLWCDHGRDRSHSRRSAARGAVLSTRECKQAAIVGWSYKYQAIMEAVLMKEMTCHYSC